MPRRIATLAASGCLVGGLGLLSPALGLWSPGASAQPNLISFCHRNLGFQGNLNVDSPYQLMTEMPQQAANGHSSHTGPIWPGMNAQGMWGDIIPPVPGILPNGLNWTGNGPAIVAAGCDVDATEEPEPPPEETTTTEAAGETTTTVAGETTTTEAAGETTTTEAAGETTTTEAAGETTTTEAAGETTTTAAGETTTTAAGATTTTTAPGGVAPPPATDTPPTVSPQPDPPFPSDPPGGSEALPPIHEVVVDPGGNEVDLGTLDSEESAQLESQLDTGITNDGDSDDTVPGATGAATGKPFGAEEIAGSILAAGGAAGLVVLLRRRNKPEIQSD